LPSNPQLTNNPKMHDEVVQELNSFFLEWRERILRRIYRQDCLGDMKEHRPEAEERLVKDGGREDQPWHRYNGYPGPEYFQKHILPTLEAITDQVDELRVAGTDSIEILERLMCGELSFSNHHTSRSILMAFFENISASRIAFKSLSGDGGRSAQGQFKYFYTLGNPKGVKKRERNRGSDEARKQQLHEARKWLTAAIAKHQGWECDRYYGGGDYTNPTKTIKELFLPPYRAVPLPFRGKAMKAFVKYGGHTVAHAYLKALPEVVGALEKEGGERYLQYYFDIAETTPSLNPNHTKGGQFPLLQAEDLVEEFKALEAMGEYKDDAMKLLKWLIPNTKHLVGVAFRDDKNVPSLTKIVRQLEEGGYTPEQVHVILDLPMRNAWLGSSAVFLLEHYAEIDHQFPGGVEKILPYLERIKSSERCIYYLLCACSEKRLPANNLNQFLGKGAELVDKLGDSANPYFLQGPRMYPMFVEIETDWESFEKRVDEALEMTMAFEDRYGAELVFDQCLCYALDPQFPEWKNGLMLLRGELKKAVELAQQNSDELSMLRDKIVPPDLWRCAVFQYTSGAYNEAYFRSGGLEGKSHDPLPEGTHFEHHARIIVHLASRGLYYGNDLSEFGELCRKGLHYSIACHIKKEVDRETGQARYELDPVEGVEMPVEPGKILAFIGTLNRIHELTDGILRDAPIRENRLSNGSDAPNVYELTQSNVAELRQAERSLVQLESDPEMGPFFNAFNLKGKIDQAIRLAYLKDMIYGSCGRAVERVDIPEDSLILAANEHTRMAIAGISLLTAIGALKLPGISVEAVSSLRYPISRLLVNGDKTSREEMESAYQTSDRLRDETAKVIPQVERMILNARNQMPGLMPIGGKIHTQKPMDPKTLDFIMKLFGLKQTAFQLIHAGGSLLIPPMPTALEFNMIIKILELFGVVDPQFPDIQVAVAGRWSERLAPYVGASVLLGTDRGVLYADGAFSTTHNDKTGARIMAYDDGVKIEGLPFDVETAKGRTDMLGRHSLGDSHLYQILGTLASHQEFGGVFGNRMKGVNESLAFILKKYGLDRHLFESAWVFDQAKEGDDSRNYERMVRRFTEARMMAGNSGVKWDVQRLINMTQQDIAAEREMVIREQPDEYDRLMKY